MEISGPDAARFVQMLTPRDLSQMAVGQCKYVLITNAEGGFKLYALGTSGASVLIDDDIHVNTTGV